MPGATMTILDALIIGGGPAGTVTARWLASAGLAVAVAERAAYETARIGESLPPAARPLLAEAGMLDAFLAQGHEPSYQTRSAWGGPELAERDFIQSPYGSGWHLDRRRFDALLARTAAAAGARLLLEMEPVDLLRDRCGWRVTLCGPAGTATLRARFLVDATGRAATIGRRLGARRELHDRLVGAAVRLRRGPAGDLYGASTLVEATADGWWYSAPLPDGEQVAVFMTDGDLCRRVGGSTPAGWFAQLHAARHTFRRVAAARPLGPPRVWPAISQRLLYAPNGDWLPVGDAALAFDPLSSDGICFALRSARAAAAAVSAALAGDSTAPAAYAAANAQEFAAYLRTRAAHYALETRWPEQSFWRRRRHLDEAPRR
jgi:flavin-dependent dehydrogenase